MTGIDDWYFDQHQRDEVCEHGISYPYACQFCFDDAAATELDALAEATRDLGREQAAQRIYEDAVNDNVMHPNHYARWAMEPIEFIAINDLPWWLANVIKYCMRYDAKDGLQDLYKARSYLEMKIRRLEGVERFWDKPVTEERMLDAEVQNRS